MCAKLRTRIAPTPSGYLHLGNVLSFVLTWVYALIRRAEIFLRIDDLDGLRCRKEFVEDIFSTLEFLGLEWDLGPQGVEDFEKNYSQRLKLERYNKLLLELCAHETKPVYGCVCSRKMLNAQSQGIVHYPGICRNLSIDLGLAPVWRFKCDPSILCGDPVIKRREGYAAYHIASIADDLDYACNLIVRGQDLLMSTLIQKNIALYLRDGSKFISSIFKHHSMVVGSTGNKLSKSRRSPSIAMMRENGINAQKIYIWVGRVLHSQHTILSAYDLVESFRDKPESLLSFNTIRSESL